MTTAAREQLVQRRRAMPTDFHDGKGRPTKQQRRKIDRLKRGLAIAILLAVPTAVQAQEDDQSTPVPVDPQVTIGTLSNGIRYYIRENGRPENRAELRLVVKAGSVLEDDDQQGLAHFTEHMAFNGTRHFARQDLVSYFELVGMRMGPHLNAYTSFDETVYMLRVPTDSAGVMETAMQVLGDWASGITFDDEEIEKERGVVIEEWRLGRGANQRMLDQQLPILFRGSRYADRLPIGRREVLETFEHDAVRRFYRDWYRPELMAVIAVGDFEAAEIEMLIREQFASIPSAANARIRETFSVPDNDEPLYAIATDGEATSTSVAVLFKQDLRDHSTLGAYRQDIVESLFTSMLNARFFELGQEADPPFLRAGAGQGRFIGAKEVFSLSAGVRPEGVGRGLDALLTEAERVARHGFAPTELERVRLQRLRNLERTFAEREKRNSRVYASQYLNNFLRGTPIPGIEAALALNQELLPGITLDEVNQLARQWITPDNRVILVSAPEKEDVPVPSEAELQAVFAHVSEKEIEPYTDEVADAPLVAEEPAGSAIASERTIPEIDVTVWELANGVRVVLKPTDFQDDQVILSAFSPGGHSLATDEQYISASNASGIVNASGVGAFSVVALRKALTGKVVRMRPFIGTFEEGFSGSASPQDLETMFRLIYLYFQPPRRDEAAVQALRTRMITFAENRGQSPDAAYGDTVSVTMAQHHFRRRPFTPEIVDELDPEVSYAFYQDRFADASDFTFVIVGNIDLDSIRPLVQTWLGGLPSIGRVETWRDPDIDPPTGVVERTVYRGVEPKSRTQIVFTGAFDYSRDARHAFGSLASALRIRLREVLREDLGGTYSVSVGGGASIRPDTTYSFRISFGADPQRLEELVAVVFAEIEHFKEAGPSDSTVRKVQEAQRRSRETGLRQNGYWTNALVTSFRFGRDPLDIIRGDELTDALTAIRLRDLARQYLRTDNYVRISLYPEQPNP